MQVPTKTLHVTAFGVCAWNLASFGFAFTVRTLFQVFIVLLGFVSTVYIQVVFDPICSQPSTNIEPDPAYFTQYIKWLTKVSSIWPIN